MNTIESSKYQCLVVKVQSKFFSNTNKLVPSLIDRSQFHHNKPLYYQPNKRFCNLTLKASVVTTEGEFTIMSNQVQVGLCSPKLIANVIVYGVVKEPSEVKINQEDTTDFTFDKDNQRLDVNNIGWDICSTLTQNMDFHMTWS